jgi:hypothetical protein
MYHLVRIHQLALLTLLTLLTLIVKVSSHSLHDNPEQDPHPSILPTRLEELQRKWDFEVCFTPSTNSIIRQSYSI